MKKVTLILLTFILISVPMHLITAQTTAQNEKALNPDLMMYVLGSGDDSMADMQDDDGMGQGMMSGGMMGGGMMGGGMMGGGMMCGGMMGNRMMGGHMGAGMMGGNDMMHGMRLYAMFIQLKTTLGITPDQLGKIQSQVVDFVRVVAPIEANIKIAQAELASLLLPLLDVQGPNVDVNMIDQRLHNVKRLEADKTLAAIKMMINIKGIFTPEQLQRLQTYMLEMVNKMHGGKNMMPDKQSSQPKAQ